MFRSLRQPMGTQGVTATSLLLSIAFLILCFAVIAVTTAPRSCSPGSEIRALLCLAPRTM